MKKLPGNPMSGDFVCGVLQKKGIITPIQAKKILNNEDSIKSQLIKSRASVSIKNNTIRIDTPVTIIDVILALNIEVYGEDTSHVLGEEELYLALAEAWGVEYRKIDPLSLDYDLVTATIPRSFATKHLVLPISFNKDTLVVATSNPFNKEAMDDIFRVSKKNVLAVLSTKSDILKLIDEFFGFKRSIVKAEGQFSSSSVDLGNLEQLVQLKSADELPSDDQHIVNAVNHLFNYAFDQRASDIHIEPKRDTSVVRMRIDGVLHSIHSLPKKVHNAIVSRIKALSRLDMAEKRRPQDGRIKTDKAGVEVDIRVSTIPVVFGEKVVLRLLDPDIMFKDLKELGFSDPDFNKYQKIIRNPHGIALVCGPTGSGKSTSLYSTLRTLSTPEINITTIEDPIEMISNDFNQIAVHPSIGITFSSILRNILRQDPDIIMIGEMRDLETAQNAIQAALTGHLVFSTLHTNDTVSSIVRLLDLGIPSFLIQASLIGIISQRLVRQICDDCKETFEVDIKKLATLGIDLTQKETSRLFRGKGCSRCRGTGFHGRTSVFEILPYTETLRGLTQPAVSVDDLRAQAIKEGMVTLRENAIDKMLRGETTYQEILRVTWDHQK